MSKVRLVVAGNGMVGHRFIEELIERARDPPLRDHCLRCRTPSRLRSRPSLSYFPSHQRRSLLVKPGFYDKHGIRLLLGVAVKNRQGQPRSALPTRALWSVTLLVLATGSTLVPPIAGSQHHERFAHRTIEDLKAIRSAAKSGKMGW